MLLSVCLLGVLVIFHIFLHFVLPAFVAVAFGKQRVFVAYCLMMATMLVDIDHILATPIYDPMRCSIGFHPLHQPWLFPVYLALAVWPKTKWIGIGLLLHMLLDTVDCYLNLGIVSN